jgi:hypothetical protein
VKTILILVAMTAIANAEPETKAPFVELNLMPFIFHGWSAFGGYGYHHVQVGAGAYAFKLPAFIRDSGFDGADGLDVHSQIGLAAFGRYFLNEHETGFYGAVQLGWERFGFAMDSAAGESHAYETYIDPYVGYVWKPMHNGFYVNPNAGVAFSTSTSGTFAVNGQSYKFKGFVPLAFFQVGYAFE